MPPRNIEREVRPVPAEVNPRRVWTGLYEMTPDHHAIIGPSSNVKGLYFVNGFQRSRRNALAGVGPGYG